MIWSLTDLYKNYFFFKISILTKAQFSWIVERKIKE